MDTNGLYVYITKCLHILSVCKDQPNIAIFLVFHPPNCFPNRNGSYHSAQNTLLCPIYLAKLTTCLIWDFTNVKTTRWCHQLVLLGLVLMLIVLCVSVDRSSRVTFLLLLHCDDVSFCKELSGSGRNVQWRSTQFTCSKELCWLDGYLFVELREQNHLVLCCVFRLAHDHLILNEYLFTCLLVNIMRGGEMELLPGTAFEGRLLLDSLKVLWHYQTWGTSMMRRPICTLRTSSQPPSTTTKILFPPLSMHSFHHHSMCIIIRTLEY